MSVLKIILIVGAVGLILVIAIYYLALGPKITDLGQLPAYQPLMQKSLTLTKAVVLYDMKNELHRFRPVRMTDNISLTYPKLFMLPSGTQVTLTGLKSYYNAVSGYSSIYALGECPSVNGSRREFEYEWGLFTGKLDKKDLPELPQKIWQ